MQVLTSWSVRNLLGLQDAAGFVAPGVQVVTGPNFSGKSVYAKQAGAPSFAGNSSRHLLHEHVFKHGVLHWRFDLGDKT